MKTIKLDTDNLGGLLHLYAIPATSFVQILKDYVNNTHRLEITNSDSIIDIPVLSNDTYIYNEENTTSDAGDCWEVSIEGFIPRLSPDNQELIEQLERELWYVVAQDANGELHLCGQEDAWMIFTTSKTSGQSAASRNGTTFVFACTQDSPTIFITDFYVE